MTGSKPSILYVCAPSHTRQVFRQDDYTRLQTYFDLRANATDKNYTSEQVADEIAGRDALMTGWGAPPLTPDAMKKADRLRFIAHSAGSVQRLLGDVVSELREREIRVFSARRGIAYNVAETTIGLMIMISRRWLEQIAATRAGEWRSAESPPTAQFLRGATVGLIAASAVGREVIALLKPFDVTTLVYDPHLSEYEAGRLGVERTADLDELFARSDFVSSHAPSIPETNKMVGARQLAKLRDGGVFINTSRGSVVDHEALTEESATGRLYVALDVSTPEPLPPDHPLRSMPNVYITPHRAGTGYYGYFKIGASTLAAIEAFFQGRPFEGEVDLARWEVYA